MPIGLYRQNLLGETISAPTQYNIDVLVIGGGGGGGKGHGAGGGGAGGVYRTYQVSGITKPIFDVGTTYTITVGSGGAGIPAATSGPSNGSSGSQSSITGTGFTSIIAYGGQGGLYSSDAVNPAPATGPTTGGSSGSAFSGGTPVFLGKSGGTAKVSSNSTYQNGGGGGGSNAVGKDGATGTTADNGDGGAGISNSITGTSLNYAGGGGGAIYVSGGGDGIHGGGDGSFGISPSSTATNGTANTGGGGGGTLNGSDTANATAAGSGSGGSGIVIIRVPTSQYTGTTTGSPTITTDGADTIMKFTSSGSYTA